MRTRSLVIFVQGKENARDGIVIWKATDLESNEMTIFVTGLSNAFERVKHPLTQEEWF